MTVLVRWFAAALVGLSLVFTAAAQEAGMQPPPANSVQLTQVASGFSRPLFVTHAGDGSGRLFVVEQGGRVWVIAGGQRLDAPFLDVSTLVSPEANGFGYTERGLLGLAFHPQYSENGVLFINYTDRSGATVIARYRTSASDPNRVDPDSSEIILTHPQPYANHNGGHLAFGPDGYLYIGFGDGGSQGDPQNNGQNLRTWLGAILRIDVGASGAYRVPEDNPFVGRADAAPEIWAYGLRNPWRFSFDRATGDLYIGDVGGSSWEEVNFQAASSGGGQNYGWDLFEGTHPIGSAPPPVDLVLPIAEYPHSEGISITGGYVYRGELLPALQGFYLYGDFGFGTIWTAWNDADGGWRSESWLRNTGLTISSFGEDEAGELYVVDYAGTLVRLDPAG